MAKLFFYYSAMNAGKSFYLLQEAYAHIEKGLPIILFVPKFGNNTCTYQAVSRVGLRSYAVPVGYDFSMYGYIRSLLRYKKNSVACVYVDEAHFLKKHQILDLARITDILNIPVTAFGLRSDFLGNTFEGSLELLLISDKSVGVKTLCFCGRDAVLTIRLDSTGKRQHEGAQILLGGNEIYKSVCRKHFYNFS